MSAVLTQGKSASLSAGTGNDNYIEVYGKIKPVWLTKVHNRDYSYDTQVKLNGFSEANPSPSTVKKSLNGGISSIVNAYNFLSRTVEAYKGFLTDISEEAVRRKLNSVDISEDKVNKALVAEFRESAYDRSRIKIAEASAREFRTLPPEEKSAVEYLAAPKTFSYLVQEIGFGLPDQFKGEALKKHCDLVFEALSWHATNKHY